MFAFSSTVISILFFSLPHNISTSTPLPLVSFFFCLSVHFCVCSNFWFASLGWNLDLACLAVPFAKTIRNHDVMLMLTWSVSDMLLNQHLKRQRNSGAYLLIAMVSYHFQAGGNKLYIFAWHRLCSHKDLKLYLPTWFCRICLMLTIQCSKENRSKVCVNVFCCYWFFWK